MALNTYAVCDTTQKKRKKCNFFAMQELKKCSIYNYWHYKLMMNNQRKLPKY